MEKAVLMDTKGLMAYLHIGKDRAYALMRTKGFPSTKLGKTYIVTEEKLVSWLENNAGREVVLDEKYRK